MLNLRNDVCVVCWVAAEDQTKILQVLFVWTRRFRAASCF